MPHYFVALGPKFSSRPIALVTKASPWDWASKNPDHVVLNSQGISEEQYHKLKDSKAAQSV